MKAAIIKGPNQIPVYGDFKEPIAQAGYELITVTSAALTHLTKGRADGSHYSSSDIYPFVVGVDGVGRNASGQRLYFVKPTAPFGGMAEKVLVRTENCIPLPDGLDDVTAAGIANPGMSSMAALKFRAALKTGETVLVNGATGIAGKLAVQIAKHLGAKKIIATGRDIASLQKLKTLGADITINLTLEPERLEEAFVEQIRNGGVDVVLDYLYGKSAEILLTTLAKNSDEDSPIRYVNIGSGAGQEISLPSAILRAIPITLMGSGLGSVASSDLITAISDVMETVIPGKLEIETTAVPLADVEKSWNADFGKSRVVFVVK